MKKVLFMFLIVSCNLAPGSYPYAERFVVNLPEDKFIEIVEKYKLEKNNENKFLNQLQLKDGRRSNNDKWYHVYFQDFRKNKIIKTWVRKKSNKEVVFALVGIKKYSNKSIENWKFINKDFSKLQNKKEIEDFENDILYQLGINDFIED